MSGHVRIGIVPTAAQFVLPAVARQLLREAPAVTLRTVVGLVDTLKPQLLAGEIDMMVGTEIGPEAGYRSKLLAVDAIVVAASANHEVFREARPTLKSLTVHRWALQPPGAPTRDWLDHTFDRKHLPRPRVQVESTMLLMLPTLIEQTGLLSFISRHHLVGSGAKSGLKEVPIKEATMHRRLAVTYRDNSYLSPAAARLIALFGETGRDRGANTSPATASVTRQRNPPSSSPRTR
jgi:DNA-binding transcriptional LysR family regulator